MYIHTHTTHTRARARAHKHTRTAITHTPLITVPLPAVPALPPLSPHSPPSLLLPEPHLVGIVGAGDEPYLRHELQNKMTKKREDEVANV